MLQNVVCCSTCTVVSADGCVGLIVDRPTSVDFVREFVEFAGRVYGITCFHFLV